VIVVALDPHHAHNGAAATAAAAVVRQVQLTLTALGLAFMMVPLAAAIEPYAALFTKALPNFVPSLPCQDILTERRGVHLIALVAINAFIVLNGFQLAAVEANPRATRLLLHTMLAGLGSFVVLPLWYASALSSPSTIWIVANFLWTGVV
jgi:hypothetical protein